MEQAVELRVVEGDASEDREGFGVLPELPGGLPVYANPTIEGVESTWTVLDERDRLIQLKRGAIAHAISLESVYGDNGLAQFAGRMRVSHSAVLDWLATYRRLARLSDIARERVMGLNLRYSHYRAANGIKQDHVFEALLTGAADKGWNVGQLMDAIQRFRQHSVSYYPMLDSEPPPVTGPMMELGTGIYTGSNAQEGYDESSPPPTPKRMTDEEAIEMPFSTYEKDLLERFFQWLAGKQIRLVDGESGEVLDEHEVLTGYVNDELS